MPPQTLFSVCVSATPRRAERCFGFAGPATADIAIAVSAAAIRRAGTKVGKPTAAISKVPKAGSITAIANEPTATAVGPA
ncbi:MAG: hypothetical protein HYZ72_12710 [Deltaproteobacteria bacterium]|nr:hypothetical protein [Deltaproteobacteria bacterium]